MDKRESDRRLWYEEPATEWIDALPIGNGRIGAMIYGCPGEERVQINEESLWAGGHEEKHVTGAADHLDKIRQCLFNGEYETAQDLCNEHLLGEPPGIRPYLPFCDLLIKRSGPESMNEYERELDLSEGISRVTYQDDGTTYTREYFVSKPDDVLIVRLEADEPGEVDALVRLNRKREARTGVDGDDELLIRG